MSRWPRQKKVYMKALVEKIKRRGDSLAGEAKKEVLNKETEEACQKIEAILAKEPALESQAIRKDRALFDKIHQEEFGRLADNERPKRPREYIPPEERKRRYDDSQKRDAEHLQLKVDNPPVLTCGNDLIKQMLEIGKYGMEKHMYPLVQFATNFCIGTRAQELNPKNIRVNGDQSSDVTHFWANANVAGKSVIQTLVLKKPSKQGQPFTTIAITEQDDFETVKSFLTFLMDPRNQDREIYSDPLYFLQKEPCGASADWSRIWPKVTEKFDLARFVESWGYLAMESTPDRKTASRRHFLPCDGRSFVANCIGEKMFDTQSHHNDTVTALLGHKSPAAKLSYMKIVANPRRLTNLKIMKNQNCDIHGVNHGVYLIETNPIQNTDTDPEGDDTLADTAQAPLNQTSEN